MSTIRQTVSNALSANRLTAYESAARPVVVALELREQRILRQARSVLSSQGVRRTEAEEILISVGLVEPPAPAAPATAAVTGNGDLGQQVANLVAVVTELVGFAQQNGFRPTTRR